MSTSSEHPASDGSNAFANAADNNAQDVFAELGLPRRFDLDSATIQRAFLRRSALMHPDTLGGLTRDIDDANIPDATGDIDASENADTNQQVQASARLSAANALLMSDERRANALLSLLGGPAPNADRSLPAGFLDQIMQTRMEMEDSLGGDGAERNRLAWRAWAAAQRAEYRQRVTSLFQQAQMPAAIDLMADRAELFASIRLELNGWRYIERMIEQLDPMYRPDGG